MVAEVFINVIEDLAAMGLLNVILPFLLFFTILFAILQKTKVLGVDENDEPRKQFNVVIALVMALMIVVPHVTMGDHSMQDATLENGWPDPVVIINKSLPQISVIAVAIVMVMLLLGLVGGKAEFSESHTGWVAIIAGAAVVGIFTLSWLDRIPYWLEGFLDEGTIAIVLILLAFGLIIYFIVRDSGDSGDRTPNPPSEPGG